MLGVREVNELSTAHFQQSVSGEWHDWRSVVSAFLVRRGMPVGFCAGIRIFIMSLAVMVFEAWVSCKMVFAGLESVKADGFTAGGGERDARNGGGGGCA